MTDREIPSAPIPALVLASVFAALTAVGAYISIPIPGSPVPVDGQTLFVLLAGMVLGWRWGVASIAVYLIIGLFGFPVFSGGRGGFAHLLGPTGGYLVGFLFAAGVTGLITHGPGGPEWLRGRKREAQETASDIRRPIARDITAVVVASLAVYAFGVPWLKAVTGMKWPAALAAGLAPFIVGDVLKAAAAVAAVRLIEPVLRTVIGSRYRKISYGTDPEDGRS